VIPAAGALLLFHELGDLRHRIPRDALVELAALRALVRQILLALALAVLAATTVIVVSLVPARGGVVAAVIGGGAIGSALGLAAYLARSTR
jgi:hypothetical protein